MGIFCRKEEQEIASLEKQILILNEKNDQLQASLNLNKTQLTNCTLEKKKLEHYAAMYNDLPTMDEMIISGVAKKTDNVSFQNQIKTIFVRSEYKNESPWEISFN